MQLNFIIVKEIDNMSYSGISANDLLNLRNKVKTEMNRRTGYGSTVGYGASTYDFTASSNGNISPNEMRKTIEPLLAVKDLGKGYNKIPVTSDSAVDISVADAFVSTLSTESIVSSTGSCRSACSGLCHGTCIGTCNGCQGQCNAGCQGCTGCSGCSWGSDSVG
jgi:hypothetical protein